MKLLEEYKRSLKHVEAEEPLDLFLYRIISFLFVKLIYPLPITPNQLSLAALIAGVGSAFFFAQGTAAANTIAALMYAVYYLFDLSDGQVARLKKNGTRVGRIIDGIADYVTHFSIYLALGISYGTFAGWMLVLITLICLMTHVILFDFYRNRYLGYMNGQISLYGDDFTQFQREYQQMKEQGKHYFDRAVFYLYLKYLRVQQAFIPAKEEEQIEQKFDREDFLSRNRTMIRWWSFMGSSLHITFLIIAALINKIDWYLYGILSVINLYALIMMLMQKSIDNGTKFKEGTP